MLAGPCFAERGSPNAGWRGLGQCCSYTCCSCKCCSWATGLPAGLPFGGAGAFHDAQRDRGRMAMDIRSGSAGYGAIRGTIVGPSAAGHRGRHTRGDGRRFRSAMRAICCTGPCGRRVMPSRRRRMRSAEDSAPRRRDCRSGRREATGSATTSRMDAKKCRIAQDVPGSAGGLLRMVWRRIAGNGARSITSPAKAAIMES